jgi:outer membrane lipoprotein SlyB
VADPTQANDYINFYDQDSRVGHISGNASGGIFYSTSGADFAEYLPWHEGNVAPEPGSVLGLSAGGLQYETTTADRTLVVSTAPAFVGNAPDDVTGMLLMTFMGQVPVRVRGPVQAGDLLVASGLGDGMAVAISLAQLTPALANQIVGQALQSSVESDSSLINTLVGLPTDAFWAVRLADLEAQLAQQEARLAQIEAVLDLAEAGASDE